MSDFYRYSSFGVLISSSPASITENNSGYFLSPLKLVESSSISLDQKNDIVQTVGFDSILDVHNNSPLETKIQISTILSDGRNEALVGLNTEGGSILSKLSGTWSKNFYFLIRDDAEDVNLTSESFENSKTLSIGDCFLESYNVSCQIGGLCKTSFSFVGENLIVENIGATNKNPSYDADLAYINTGSFAELELERYSEDLNNIAADCILSASDVQIAMSTGNRPFLDSSNIFYQSFNLAIPVNSTPIYGFGKNSVRNRKIKKPSIGAFSFDAVVKNISTGDFREAIYSSPVIDFDIDIFQKRFGDGDLKRGMSYSLHGAKLQSVNISQSLDGFLNFSAEYIFDIATGVNMFGTDSLTEFMAKEDGSLTLVEDLFPITLE